MVEKGFGLMMLKIVEGLTRLKIFEKGYGLMMFKIV